MAMDRTAMLSRGLLRPRSASKAMAVEMAIEVTNRVTSVGG
jgi:hypothetical protein